MKAKKMNFQVSEIAAPKIGPQTGSKPSDQAAYSRSAFDWSSGLVDMGEEFKSSAASAKAFFSSHSVR